LCSSNRDGKQDLARVGPTHRRAHDAASDDGEDFESSIDLRSERRCSSSGPLNQTYGFFSRGSVIGGESISLRASAVINQMAVLFTAPVASRLHLKNPTVTGFFTLAASRWRMIIGYESVSTAEQNLGLRHDDLTPAFDASVDQTGAENASTRINLGVSGRRRLRETPCLLRSMGPKSEAGGSDR